MKVYAVCEACDDAWYRYLAPSKVFKDKAKAQAYAKELFYNEDIVAVIFDYELE